MKQIWILLVALLAQLPLLWGSDARSQTSPDGERAVIVWVGAHPEAERTSALMHELLGRQGVTTRVTRHESFRPEHVLDATRGDRAVWVFVVPQSNRAALFFRDPSGERFLVRDLELAGGLDAVGRELLGQAVESSVVALLRTKVGVSREQVRAAVEQRASEAATASESERSFESPADTEREPEGAPESPVDRDAGAVAPAASPRDGPPASPVEGWVAFRYAMRHGDQLTGLEHAPGLELGIGYWCGALLRLRGTYEYAARQRLATGPVDVRLQTQHASAAFDLGIRIGLYHLLIPTFGIGLDITRIDPRAILDPTLTLAAARTNLVPTANFAIRYEGGNDHLRLAVALMAETLLLDTHYDLDRDGTSTRIAEPWPVRPGALVALGWSPGGRLRDE